LLAAFFYFWPQKNTDHRKKIKKHPLFASLHFSRISRKGAKKGNEEKLWQFSVLLNAVNANG
jgi:hypothetical protein